MNLEAEFHQAMLDAYQRAGREAGYWGNYFLRSVKIHGGLQTAKRMLRAPGGAPIQKGFQALVDAGRPDLSLEALVLTDRFAPLFSEAELAEARRRLQAVPSYARRRRMAPAAIFPDALPPNHKYVVKGARQVLVNAYERDPRARKACLRLHGDTCQVCGFDFEKRYGDIGKGFIHVHHIKPLALLRRGYALKPSRDLVPVCPNCHAMLHSSYPPLSVLELTLYLRNAPG